MKVESIEIYSDAANMAIMRHPGRKFPGVLIQGDTLANICSALDIVCERERGKMNDESWQELNQVRNGLWGRLAHYKSVLQEHGVPLPFSDQT